MDRTLKGRHVVVTGGSGALGGAVLEHLVAAGAEIHVPSGQAVPPRLALADHPQVHVTAGIDLRDEDAVVGYFAGLPQPWASIQLAGGFAAKPAIETSRADFLAMMEGNAVTAFLASREALRRMRGAGGRIVNVAARPALVPVGGMIAYATSKAAVAALTQALAVEARADGVLVNAVVPSIIDTPANRRAMPGADHGSWPKPAELAEVIGFLASPRNSLTSGALVPVYGVA